MSNKEEKSEIYTILQQMNDEAIREFVQSDKRVVYDEKVAKLFEEWFRALVHKAFKEYLDENKCILKKVPINE